MPLVDNAWYVNFGNGSSTGYYAVTAWAAAAGKVCGALVRQLAAPAVGSERVFVCIASTGGTGTTGGAEPAWTVTRGAKTTDNTLTWQEATGIAALNGDKTNTPKWTDATIKGQAIVLGQVIQNSAGTLILICTTAGTAGSGAEPSWSAFTNAGATTADNTATWTTLGSSFGVLAAPHARLGNAWASTWGQAGNTFFVADNHAETQSSNLTLVSPSNTSNIATVAYVYSFDHTLGSVPPTASNTGASISTTGSATIAITGAYYINGLAFNCGSGANSSQFTVGQSSIRQVFENCSIAKLGTTANLSAMVIGTGASTSEVVWRNTTVKFGATGDALVITNGGVLRWYNTPSAIQGATIPGALFNANGFTGVGNLTLKGVDLSALGSNNLIGTATAGMATIASLVDCKLGSGWPVETLKPIHAGTLFDIIRCDSGATNYMHARFAPYGSQVVETTIVRTGGATDGTTPVSWKIVTNTTPLWVCPFESLPIAIWNDTTGSSVTATVYGIWGGGAVPNNDDIWIEAEYLGSSSTPQGSFISNTKASNLATGSALSSDGSTWGGSTTKFKMSVTFTPQMKGPINLVVKAAKASSTFYIDPLIVLS